VGVSTLRALAGRSFRLFSYTPLLAIASAVALGKTLVYARLMEVEQFGVTSQMLLVSTLFGLVGTLGTQLIAHRDVPGLLYGGRRRRGVALLAQSILVTGLVALLCAMLVLAGLRLFSLSGPQLLVGIAHGLAQQAFVTLTIESKSRLAMVPYALQVLVRTTATSIAGALVAFLGGGGLGAVSAELIVTVLVLPGLTTSILAASRVSFPVAFRLGTRAHCDLPWRAALILLVGSLVTFASSNLDRWLAADTLDRFAFGQYSFAWIPLTAAQSVQFLLNAGLFPLIAQRASAGHNVLGMTAVISWGLLACGFLAGVAGWLVMQFGIEYWFPQYRPAVPLIGPIMAAAAFRVSDFWASFLIIMRREGLLLKLQTGILAVVLIAWFAYAWVVGETTPMAFAWLAAGAACLSYVGNVISAWIISR
jgi:O-antigen/teichoic acid export membrane protein